MVTHRRPIQDRQGRISLVSQSFSHITIFECALIETHPSSFVDRAKDTLKVGGAQVSPTEVEEALLAQPDKLIIDVCVAGVTGGRTSDEKNPRAWIVLSETGQARGAREAIEALDQWARKNLSRYKWLRGGYEIVDQVRQLCGSRECC